VRRPDDFASFRQPLSRRRIVTIVLVLVALFGVTGLRSAAVLWTDSLWFDSVGASDVFSGLLTVKVGLVAVFGLAFFVVLWGNLLLARRFASRDLTFEPEDEAMRQIQAMIRPYSFRITAALSLVLGLIAGLAAMPEWNSYLLFSHAQNFGTLDPLFKKDLGFYVFRLPFMHFIVDWALASTVIITILTTGYHYLNGGIRASRVTPRVSPQVKVHLSILLAVVALLKAAGYVLARYSLVTSSNGYIQGASYTDVHARMPALSILFWLSLAAAIILLANTVRRGWTLPALAAALWAFVALVIGVIYPAALQTFKVTPSQSTLEIPYIDRNIAGTRIGFGLQSVGKVDFAGASSITPQEIAASQETLNNIRLWDPSADIALETVQRRQAIQSYYTFTTLGVDRYNINGKITPVLVGARQLNMNNLPARSWVNQHLQYTHGYGMVISPANTFDPETGNPVFALQDIPPRATQGLPQLTTPGVYFGINDPGWVVANSKQAELDYKTPNGTQVESHYSGAGGVEMSNFFRRTAFALRYQDLNLWISGQITAKSRMLFERDVLEMAKKVAPFLSFDSHPYAVMANGRVQFVLDGYTTSNNFPYSEDATSQGVPNSSGLPQSFNYVRNSVKVVIDAYDGSVKLYAFGNNGEANDPILAAYRSAFPKLFQPASSMPEAIRQHLRYPQDLFAVQASLWGRYHIDSAAAFYTASDRWQVSPTTGAGSPSQALQSTVVTSKTGVVTSITSQMEPISQVMALPGEKKQQLVMLSSYVPAGATATVQGLTGFLTVTANPENYGQLTSYVTPRGTSVTGPVQANSEINQNARVSTIITPLDQHGSNVLLGHNLMIPLHNSVLYVRPLYVTSSATPLPQLKYVIAVFNQDVAIETSLSAALSDVLGANVGNGGNGGGEPTGTTQTYLAQAAAAYAEAQRQLKAGNLAQYQAQIDKMGSLLQKAEAALAAGR